MDKYEKVWVILLVWLFLIILSIIYCYFLEQRIFPNQKLFDMSPVQHGRCYNKDCLLNNRRLHLGQKKMDQSSCQNSFLKQSAILASTDSDHYKSDCSTPALGQFGLMSGSVGK